ncbi:MAG: hypothetical protein AB8H79_00865 [Myxococcota bacterium]
MLPKSLRQQLLLCAGGQTIVSGLALDGCDPVDAFIQHGPRLPSRLTFPSLFDLETHLGVSNTPSSNRVVFIDFWGGGAVALDYGKESEPSGEPEVAFFVGNDSVPLGLYIAARLPSWGAYLERLVADDSFVVVAAVTGGATRDGLNEALLKVYDGHTLDADGEEIEARVTLVPNRRMDGALWLQGVSKGALVLTVVADGGDAAWLVEERILDGFINEIVGNLGGKWVKLWESRTA